MKRQRVLLNSLFHPELVRGGAQQVCYELFDGLKKTEHTDVMLLCAIEERFNSLYKSGARITGFDRRDGEFLFLSRNYDYLWHRCRDFDLVNAYADFLRETRPDVVHFHHFLLFGLNLISLTRNVLPECKIVFTLHEFLAICHADGQMLRKHDGSLCTKSSNVRCNQCCPDVSPEQFFMRELSFKSELASVDHFTIPSNFMKKHFTDWGLPAEKILYAPNGQRDYNFGNSKSFRSKKANRFGFFGQLVDNKGVWLLLEAVSILRNSGFTDFAVEINGDNMIYASDRRRKQIEEFLAEEDKLPENERIVTFNGSYSVENLSARMSRVDWCVVPSTWWEIFGLVISEAFMFGRPVISTNVGGPGERIKHEVNGLQFSVGDARSLADSIYRAATEPALWEKLNSGIAAPDTQLSMVDRFSEIYRM